MTEFGKTLREAREAKGYTVSQLAEETRLMHQIVEDMENEVFSRIPAPIYGRGFVKLYCEAVGLDPKPMVEAYMALQAGDQGGKKGRHRHQRQPPPFIPPEPPPAAEEAAPQAGAPGDGQPQAERRPAGRSAFTMPRVRLPANTWRVAVVAAGAILALWALFAGVRAVYRASMTPPAPEAEPATEAEMPTQKAEAARDAQPPAAPAKRTPAAIPPLYID